MRNGAGRIVVIGASTGGVEALKEFIGDISPDTSASFFVVWHMAADCEGLLPVILNRLGGPTAETAEDGEAILPGRIYVAPPDRHLTIGDGIIHLGIGPKENRFRPAVDPLFRSAAYHYGPAVIGILLSGALDDGTAGLWSVGRYGGVTIVQDPSDAVAPSMPASALRQVKIDYCVPAREMSGLLEKLTKMEPGSMPRIPAPEREFTHREVAVAAGAQTDPDGIFPFGEKTVFTCPECHGALSEISEENLIRYRCHTGHGYSQETLEAALNENVEKALSNVIRAAEERITILRQHAGILKKTGETASAERLFQQAGRDKDWIMQFRRQIAMRK